MMKRVLFASSFIAILAITMLSFTACDPEDGVMNSQYDALETVQFNMLTESLPQINLEDATLDLPITLVPFDESERFEPVRNTREQHQKRNMVSPLRKILSQLNLTEEQRISISRYMLANRDCEMAILRALRESEMEIINSANAERREIMAQFQAGEITREEARELINALNRETRQALFNNPVRARAMEAIKNCRETLFDNIRSILTEEQLVRFNRLLGATGTRG